MESGRGTGQAADRYQNRWPDEKLRKALAEKWIVQSGSKAAYAQIILDRTEGRVPYSVRIGPEVEQESQTDLAITVVEVEAPPSSPLLKQDGEPTT